MKRTNRTYRAPRRYAPPARKATERQRSRAAPAEDAPAVSVDLLRIVACGVIFVSLVALKLLSPGSMTGVRGTLGSWLVRDADFSAAFSAVGHAVSGEGGVLNSLENAYVAVFGEEQQEAQEVSGTAQVARDGMEPQSEDDRDRADTADEPAAQDESGTASLDTRDLPAHAVAEQRILGFSYAAPLDGVITSGFGWREHPTSGREAFHYGVDIAADEGAAISCFADGTVGVVAESVELGKYLTVHHENGVITLYAHCSRVTVSSGAAVKMGDKLAEAGSTGNATGTHLHFEIHDGEDCLNPEYYLS